ncbi:MAG: choice-of-anchor L domain-containing protein [bacterium]
MKTVKIIYFLSFITFIVATVNAQNISVGSAVGQNPETFLNQHMVGQGVQIFNVMFCGNSGNISTPQIGTFQSNGFSELLIDSGIVMTTGNISVAPGPNNSNGASSAVNNYYTDATMSNYASSNLTSCSTLDFDFTSTGSGIYVTFCFASEEYPEYVCSQYNDVFAFLVTGTNPATGIVETRNIAIIPGTVSAQNPNGIAVAINSVNSGSPGGTGGGGTNCYYTYSYYYIDNTYSTGVQYDAYTRKMTASADIVPCETYHMHISICNVGDNAFDSGVFLEGGSLTSYSNNSFPTHCFIHETIDTVTDINPLTIDLALDSLLFEEADVDISFSGDAMNMYHFSCRDELGNLITNINHHLHFNAGEHHSLTLTMNSSTELSDPLNFQMLLSSTTRAYDQCGNISNVSYLDAFPLVLKKGAITPIDTTNTTDSVGIALPSLHDFVIYPNPAKEVLHVNASGLTHVELIAPDGTTVLSQHSPGDYMTIPTRHLSSGVYNIRVTTTRGSATRKVVISGL